MIYVPLHRPETFIHTSLSLFLPIGCFSYCRALLPTCSSMGKVCGNILLTSPSLKLMLSSLSPVRRCWCPKTLVALSVCPVEVRRAEERKMQGGPGAFLQGLDPGSSFYTPYVPFPTLHIPTSPTGPGLLSRPCLDLAVNPFIPQMYVSTIFLSNY